jgi:hypothetical protein
MNWCLKGLNAARLGATLSLGNFCVALNPLYSFNHNALTLKIDTQNTTGLASIIA